MLQAGASLTFHGNQQSPVLSLLDLYRKFGFHFDHIYAYEFNPQPADQVFAMVPKEYEAAYHWINVGVTSDEGSRTNPFNLLMDNYNEDDLVIVKLDVDSPVLERQLAEQLRTNPKLAKLIDHFYFEHHVNSIEMWGHWGETLESVEDSFQLFHGLRQKGVASHFWV